MELVQKYIEYLRYEKNSSSHTEISYFNDLKQLWQFVQDNYPEVLWLSLSEDIVREWVVELMEQGVSARSVNRKLSAVKAFYKFLVFKNYLQKSPINTLRGPKIKKKLPTFVVDHDLNLLLDQMYALGDDFISLRNVLILEMFYLTGMRRAELIGIKDDDIDYIEHTIRVTGKRNKQRLIPIDDELLAKIKRYKEQRDLEVSNRPMVLFVRENGLALYPRLVYKIVVDLLSAIPSLSKMSPHVLRHTFATSMLNAGADINAVKEILGHASLAATEIYTHTSLEELKKIYNKAHPRA